MNAPAPPGKLAGKACVLFLASEDASFYTGADLTRRRYP